MKRLSVEEFKNREVLLSKLEFELIKDLIEVRKSNNYTQQQLAEDANMVRETIAKIENQLVSPQINTLIKILLPLGYTLKIEKIKADKQK